MGQAEHQVADRHVATNILERFRNTPMTTVGLIAILSLTFYLRLLSYGQYIDVDVGNLGYLSWRLAEGEVLLDLEGPGKPPLYFMLYAIFLSLFGPSIYGLKLFGTLFVLLAVAAIYWLASQAYGKRVGLLAALLFGVFSSSPRVEGGTVNMETLLHLPTVLAIGAFLKAATMGRMHWYFLAGFCAALASLTKQVGGILFFVFLSYGLLEWWRSRAHWRWWQVIRPYLVVGTGALVPVALIVGFYWYHGFTIAQIYDTMLGSNFRYVHSGYESAYIQEVFFMQLSWILPENGLLWVGLSAAAAHFFWRSRHGESQAVDRLLLWWAVWSVAVLWVSGRFYSHYFLQIIAPFSVLAAYGIVAVWNWTARHPSSLRIRVRGAWALILVMMMAFFVKTDYDYFFTYTPEEQTAFQHGDELIIHRVVAQYILSRTEPGDTIYVWGIAPQIYFQSQRKAATSYRNNFLMSPNMTQDPVGALNSYSAIVMEDIRQSRPQYIVELFRQFVEGQQYFELATFPELQAFVRENYLPDGDADREFRRFGIGLYRIREKRDHVAAIHLAGASS